MTTPKGLNSEKPHKMKGPGKQSSEVTSGGIGSRMTAEGTQDTHRVWRGRLPRHGARQTRAGYLCRRPRPQAMAGNAGRSVRKGRLPQHPRSAQHERARKAISYEFGPWTLECSCETHFLDPLLLVWHRPAVMRRTEDHFSLSRVAAKPDARTAGRFPSVSVQSEEKE